MEFSRNTDWSDVQPPTYQARGVQRVELYFSDMFQISSHSILKEFCRVENDESRIMFSVMLNVGPRVEVKVRSSVPTLSAYM
jgi:hypothetical protein